jgi:magnesium-transporting ATPase (P-type)
MNLAACGITLIGPYIGIDTPITIIQMLWVNIIMDTLGGLAFAGEPALGYYMLEKPKRREEPILSRPMLSHVLLNGAYTLALLVFFLSYPSFRAYFGSTNRHLTAFYALFIFSGIVNSFTARSERVFIFSGIFKNRTFLAIMAFITAIQILIVYFGGSLFRSTPLTPRELGCVALLSLTVLLFDTVRRIFTKLK